MEKSNKEKKKKPKSFHVEKESTKGSKIFLIPFLVILSIIIGLNIYMSCNNFGLIIKYSEEFDVDPALVCSIIFTESKFDADAVSNKGAVGYMQVTPSTASFILQNINLKKENGDPLTVEDLKDPEANIILGTWYLKYLSEMFEGDLENTLCAYNAGPNKVKQWLANEDYSLDGKNLVYIPYRETSEYVSRVTAVYPFYDMLLKIRLIIVV